MPSQYDGEWDQGSPEALVLRGEEPSEDDKPFPPQILLLEIIFAHSPYEGVFRNQLSLQVNLLCRSGWFCLRGIAETECAILPIRELAANPRCSACEQSSSGERSSAHGSLPASVLLDEFGWRRRDSPCSGRTHSIYGSLEIASGCGRRLFRWQRFSLTLSSVCAPSACACVAVLTAERQAKNPLNIEHYIRNHPTLACVSPHTMRTLSSPTVFRLKNQQQQSFNVGASQTLGR